MAEDFYAVLGVPRTADAGAIKKAYRKLARDLHPDKNPGNTSAETRFKSVNRAYEVLGDESKRKLYDEFGEDALREGFDADKARAYKQWQSRAANGYGPGYAGAGGGGFGGFEGQQVDLEDLFGRGGVSGGGGDPFADLFGRSARRRGPMRGRDIEQELTVDFVSAVRGTTIQVQAPGASGPVTVRIPAGANEGSRVRIAGQGAPSPNGGPAGDLILEIHVEPHPFFKREGDDLHLDVPVWTSEAFKGAKVKVPTFDGAVTVKMPSHTQSGTVLRVRGKGVARKGRDPGDLYVRFMIQMPTTDSPEAEKAIDELAKYETGDPREKITV